jgi:hypothetical protein
VTFEYKFAISIVKLPRTNLVVALVWLSAVRHTDTQTDTPTRRAVAAESTSPATKASFGKRHRCVTSSSSLQRWRFSPAASTVRCLDHTRGASAKN